MHGQIGLMDLRSISGDQQNLSPPKSLPVYIAASSSKFSRHALVHTVSRLVLSRNKHICLLSSKWSGQNRTC